MIPDAGGVTAINVIELDPYVKGVVAGEMPSSWPLEALKAQAVAARDVRARDAQDVRHLDQYPDTRSQVYKGVVGESVRSNAAVDETRGEILTYAGVPAVTYYFSTSGGHTENVEYSFIGALSKPWLVGVPDPYDHHSPYHRWKATFSTAALDGALGAPGRFVRLKTLQRGVSPRVVRAQVIGTRGRRTVSGPQVRAALGLRDTWFTHVRVASSARRPRSARPASWGPPARLLALAGEFRPAPRGRRLGHPAQDGRALAHRRARADLASRPLSRRGRAARSLPGQGRLGRRSSRARAVSAPAGLLALLAVTLPGAAPAAERPVRAGGGRRAARAVRRHPRDGLHPTATALDARRGGVHRGGRCSDRRTHSVRGRERPPHAATWRCDRRQRTFTATSADGQTASAGVRTPSCARRLALRAPRRARSGRSVRLRLIDRWRLGDIAARLCVEPPGGPARCRRERIRAGRRLARTRFRALRPGGWRISARTPYGRARRTVRAARPGGRLRLLATGDSMIQIIDGFLKAKLGPRRVRVRSDAHISTGISKPSLLDWEAQARRQAAARPDVVVMFLGANDGFPMGDAPCCGRACGRASTPAGRAG